MSNGDDGPSSLRGGDHLPALRHIVRSVSPQARGCRIPAGGRQPVGEGRWGVPRWPRPPARRGLQSSQSLAGKGKSPRPFSRGRDRSRPPRPAAAPARRGSRVRGTSHNRPGADQTELQSRQHRRLLPVKRRKTRTKNCNGCRFASCHQLVARRLPACRRRWKRRMANLATIRSCDPSGSNAKGTQLTFPETPTALASWPSAASHNGGGAPSAAKSR